MDFDGTITTSDTGLHLLERLAPAAWRTIEAAYVAGEIGSRACMTAQWALLERDRERIEAVTREVPLDEGFEPLVGLLREAGCELTIVSDGYGFYAREVAAAMGLPVLTNDVDWVNFEVVFPPRADACPCDACGTCKQAPIRAARARGKTTVLIGDGTSDAKAAELADVVFAKGSLATWCRTAGRAHAEFRDLTDLAAQLEVLLRA